MSQRVIVEARYGHYFKRMSINRAQLYRAKTGSKRDQDAICIQVGMAMDILSRHQSRIIGPRVKWEMINLKTIRHVQEEMIDHYEEEAAYMQEQIDKFMEEEQRG